tara:strand:- start:138 stop:527 length:390 start_codon:yes stop_codon:yes gene_type:complete
MYKRKRNNYHFLFLLVFVCALKLFHIGYKRVHFSSDLLFNSFVKNYGSELALQDNVLEANKLIINNSILEFDLSEQLKSNGYFKQRIVEYSYPVKLNENSKFKITTLQEKINCNLKSKTTSFKLYECKK